MNEIMYVKIYYQAFYYDDDNYYDLCHLLRYLSFE